MNKLKYIALPVILLGFALISSCGSGEDVKLSEILFGTWNLQEVRVNGTRISADTANYRLTFNTDLSGTPTTYVIIGNQQTPKPNFNNATTTTGVWQMNDAETQITFDANTDSPSTVELGEFIVEAERFAYPLSWRDPNTGDIYECIFARFDPEE